MQYLDKMMKVLFRKVKVPFKDFNAIKFQSIKITVKQLLGYIVIACLLIFLETSIPFMGYKNIDYGQFLSYFLFDIGYFFLVLFLFFPTILTKPKSFQFYFQYAGKTIVGYCILWLLLEIGIQFVITGRHELHVSHEFLQQTAARGLLISMLIILFHKIRGVLLVEMESAIWQEQRIELQNDLLRAQLDPHLINNVLSVLYERILAYNKEDAKIIQLLSGLTAHAISESDEKGHITLEKEIANIRDYIKLIEICRENEIFVEWALQAEKYNETVLPPNLLLEPILNALKYGYSSRETPLIVTLRTYAERLLSFRIFNHKIRKSKQAGHRVGLKNLRERLLLNYPEKHLLNIHETETTYELNLVIYL